MGIRACDGDSLGGKLLGPVSVGSKLYGTVSVGVNYSGDSFDVICVEGSTDRGTKT